MAYNSSLHLLYGFTLSFFWLYVILISSYIPIFIYCTWHTSSIFFPKILLSSLPDCHFLLIYMAYSFISFNLLVKKHIVHKTLFHTYHNLPFYLFSSCNILHILGIYINCLPYHNVNFMILL